MKIKPVAIAFAIAAVRADDGFIAQDKGSTPHQYSPRSLQLSSASKKPAFNTAPFPNTKSTSINLRIMPSPALRPLSRVDVMAHGSPRRRTNRSSIDKTCGSSVSPGTPLSKAEQEARRDSKLPLALDGQSDYKPRTTRENFAWLATKMRLDSPQLDVFTPEANPYSSEDLLRGRHPGNARALVIFVILLLIVFGAIYSLVEYLLFATRASASCTPSTVYIPVTRYASSAPSSPPSNTTNMITVYSTSTEYLTTTSYATLQPDVMATGLTTSGGPSYYFTLNSAGSTDWLNGISPPATASLTVITRSIFVTPVMPTTSDSTTTATVTSTATLYQTITVPAYTSTTYSEVEPETTISSTSTHYVTYTVSRVSSALSSGITSARPSYSGPGDSGWNSSSSIAPGATGVAAAAEGNPQLTTLTEIHYWGDGDMTTSTTTRFITTSMQFAYTTVVTPSIPEPSDTPEMVTTVTALPVTITYSGGELFSTSIAFNSSAVSPLASTSISPSRSPFQTGASNSLPIPSISQSSSSGIYTNATSPATLSAAGYSPAVSLVSSLSSSAVSTKSSAAAPETASAISPSSSSRSVFGTAPNTVSRSASATLSSASESSSNRASSGTPPSISAGTISLASSGMTPVTSTAANLSAPGLSATRSTISGRIAPSSGVASGESSMSEAGYGPYAPSSSLSSGVAGTASSGSSADPSLSAMSTPSSSAPASAPPPAGSISSKTWSTAVRSSSSLSGPTSSVSLTTLNATSSAGSSISRSQTQRPASLSTTSNSLLSGGPPLSAATASVSSVSTASLAATTSSVTGIPATASPIPSTGCGEYGDFMLDFDNMPSFIPTNPDEIDITEAPPIPNPYHHFTWSDGYVYAPDPKVPFEPISQPHLAVFIGNGTGMRASQAGNTVEDGEFADGPYESSSAFWFDALSAWMGCDNEGPEVCTLVMSSYTYSAAEKDEVLAFTQNATIPGCPGFTNCKLQKVEFPETFKGLSGLQIQAFVGEEERMFFMDDVAMRWTDNSCAAGLARQRSR